MLLFRHPICKLSIFYDFPIPSGECLQESVCFRNEQFCSNSVLEGFVLGAITASSLCLASTRQYIASSHLTVDCCSLPPLGSQAKMATERGEGWAVSLDVYCCTIQASIGTPLTVLCYLTLCCSDDPVHCTWGKASKLLVIQADRS